MRKSVIFTIAGVLLLTLMLSAAGCVNTESGTTESGTIVGVWDAPDGSTAVFDEDNTGFYLFTAEENTPSEAYEVRFFTWKANGNNTVSLLFRDGSTENCTVRQGVLTTEKGVVYQKTSDVVPGVVEEE